MVESLSPFVRMQPSLSTGRLHLDAFQPEDAAELHEIFSDPATNTIGTGPFSQLDETVGWIERRIEAGRNSGLCWYGIRQKSSGRLIGNCGVFVGRTGATEPELGYMIRRDYQANGYASEAATAVMSECDRAQIGPVWATVRPGNRASLRVLEKIGMERHHSENDAKGELLYLSRPIDSVK